jgi:hypothetical protein
VRRVLWSGAKLKSAGHATEQAREFFDLSRQATQRVLETARAAATKSFKPIN